MLFNCLRRRIVLLRGIRFVIILMMIYYVVMSHQFPHFRVKCFHGAQVTYRDSLWLHNYTKIHNKADCHRCNICGKKHACLVTKYSAPSCAWSNVATFQRICKVVCFPVTQSDESSSKLFWSPFEKILYARAFKLVTLFCQVKCQRLPWCFHFGRLLSAACLNVFVVK